MIKNIIFDWKRTLYNPDEMTLISGAKELLDLVKEENIPMILIGKGGEVIQKITGETGAEIDIKDDGTIMIASPDKRSIDAAREWIESIVAEPEIGKIYVDVPVVSVLDFGAFVQIMPGKDGLVHISELAEDRVEKVTDVVKEGDKVTVKLVAIDDRGRLQLSMKAAQRELNDKK